MSPSSNAVWAGFALCFAVDVGFACAQQLEAPRRDEVVRVLKQAATYYRNRVASHGGYVYYYSTDLTQRFGEGKASADTIFVQPPGTPTVGMAYLDAFEATGDAFYLDAARETAEALLFGQLRSGGWTQVIHFAKPAEGRVGNYRKGSGGNWNFSSLDDDQTQSALKFLIKTDKTLGFQHAEIHDAALYGLDALLHAQFPNGAFPQGWAAPVQPRPVRTARFPDYDWRTEGKIKNYWDEYTLNDGLAGTVAEVLMVAHQVYGDEKYKAALERLGDFLILAQMPESQPGWCQQYNEAMAPIWARKFEPPAIAGSESQDVMETLIKIARYTGEDKYLDPIPAALRYLNTRCLLPGGQLARYYELETNKPLYMDENYRLTYDDSTAPSHYGWKHPARLDAIERAYRAAKDGNAVPPVAAAPDLKAKVRRIIQELDQEGRWVSTYAGERLVGQPKFQPGFRYLSSEVFSRNVETLGAYLR
jgi:PelA/Pel-15E family pectate lyase